MASSVRTLPTPLSLNDFDVGVTLGTGSFGRVRFATHKVGSFILIRIMALLIANLFRELGLSGQLKCLRKLKSFDYNK
jgi:hypothetical protein